MDEFLSDESTPSQSPCLFDPSNRQPDISESLNEPKISEMPIKPPRSLNSQKFVRSSIQRSSQRLSRASQRRRSASNKVRQVRFQPIPQSINISSDSQCEKYDRRRQNHVLPSGELRNAIQMPAKRTIARGLNNLSHKVRFSKMKLSKFNNLANQLQQRISSSKYALQIRANQPQHQSTSQKLTGQRQVTSASKSYNLVSSLTDRPDDQQCSSYSVKAYQDEDDEFDDWGSDFDEQSVSSSVPCERSVEADRTADEGSSYILEIGKSCSDNRAINDVIQDRGISGQFKSLADTSRYDDDEQANEIELDSSNDEEDEEAERRSLEARQGFRQIKDKLKIILDQRLASYEHQSNSNDAILEGTKDTSQSDRNSDQTQTSTCLNADTRGETQECSDNPVVVVMLRDEETLSDARCVRQTPQQVISDQTSPSGQTKKSPSSPNITSHEFDRQSFCSEESGASSSLGSNHSGSQDSGHSTQHSGYSARSSHPNGRDQYPASLGSESSPVEEPKSIRKDRSALSEVSNDGHQDERRNRFLKNRLIINSKLESMFKSRSSCFEEKEVRMSAESPQKSPVRIDLKPARLPVSMSTSSVAKLDQNLQYSKATHLEPQLPQQQHLTMSLRQLVKDVIDNCEKPTKLSPLTKSILNRSDSLCSDLASGGDQTDLESKVKADVSKLPSMIRPVGITQLRRDQSNEMHQTSVISADQTISSLGTIDGLEYSCQLSNSCQLEYVPASTTVESLVEKQNVGSKATLKSYLKQSWREFSRFKLSKIRIRNTNVVENSDQSNVSAKIVSDNIERASFRPKVSPSAFARSDAGLANHFVTLSNRKWKSCYLRASIVPFASNTTGNFQDPFGSRGSGRDLAYLDNSRNFTDDDT